MRKLAVALLLAAALAVLVVGIVERREIAGRYWLWRAERESPPSAPGGSVSSYGRAVGCLGADHELIRALFRVEKADLGVRPDPAAKAPIASTLPRTGFALEIENVSSRTLRLIDPYIAASLHVPIDDSRVESLMFRAPHVPFFVRLAPGDRLRARCAPGPLTSALAGIPDPAWDGAEVHLRLDGAVPDSLDPTGSTDPPRQPALEFRIPIPPAR